jgi:predicted DCC family thiol-disulfide oxidoreductase YuxK
VPERDRPLLIFDGECHFCRRWIARWRQMTGERVEYAPFQEVAPLHPQITAERFQRSVQLIETDGSVHEGAEAVFRALAYAPFRGWPLWAYSHVPFAKAISERLYRLVAGHRVAFSRLTRWLWGSSVERPSHILTRWLYLRLLGCVFLIAFVSLGVQAKGLIGENGILSAGRLLEAMSVSLQGSERFTRFPTLCWLSPGDDLVQLLWVSGAALSLLLILDFAPGPILVLLWAFYLSLSTVSGVFLNFQWDILLLEAGFLSILFAPWKLLPGLHRDTEPSPAMRWLLRFLLFRLMFASGVVKLASGDPTWWNLSALTRHYETQPLPTWIGWYAHQLSPSIQKASCAVMFFIELAVPFLIFLPRRPRLFAFALFVAFQILIGLTGNYCFFNLLTLTLSVLLLDDTLVARLFPAAMRAQSESPRPLGLSRWLRAPAVAALLIVMLPLELMALSRCARREIRWPEAMHRLEAHVYPFRIVGSYGLFSVMTTTRPEIVVEGSDDGTTWREYVFKWKPGDLRRRPGFVEPHQPRLDWQMWFAALGDFRSNPWFQNFLVRLLQGSKDVLGLLEENPFPDAPPLYVRAVLYEYHFTDARQRRKDGTWWRRERKGLYCPPIGLRRVERPAG